MILADVNVANVRTMADRSVRVTIDLLPGTADDMAEAFRLMSKDSRMVLGSKDEFADAEQE